jgi:hypothetical protein
MALNLKRRVEKSYSLDEMMYIVNKHFIEQDKARPANYNPIRRFSIESTCFDNKNDRWIVCDSRSNNSEVGIAHDPPLLPSYYGATILEAVTKCFVDRTNHYGKPKEAQIPMPAQALTVNQKVIQQIKKASVGRKSPFNG